MTLKDIDLSELTIKQGIKITGEASTDHTGWSVSGAGDVNGDGYADFIIGTYNASPLERINAGESYLVFGKKSGLTDIDLRNLTLTQGIKIIGATQGDKSGNAVSSAGDVNGDGYDDVIIAATKKSYLIFGKRYGLTNIDIKNLIISQGITIIGSNIKDTIGWSVSSAGDVNKDGYDDLIIGSHYENILGHNSAGESYLIFGKNTTNFTDIDLKNLTLPQGIKIIGANTNDTSGSSVSSAGDVNNDGYDDMIIGASDITSLEQYEAGKSYLIFGDESNVPSAPTTTAPTIAPTTTPTTATPTTAPTTTAPTTAPTTTAPTATAPTTAPTTTAPTAYTPPTSTPDNNDLNKYEIIGISIFGVVAFGSLMFYGYKYIKNLEAYTTRNTVHQTLIGANEHTRTSYSNLDDISLEDA